MKPISSGRAEGVRLKSSFEDILGKKADVFSEAERRLRWAKWLRLCRSSRNGEAREVAEMWRDRSGCRDCKHLRGTWCQSSGLPCTVNPILSFRQGMLGMACMGMGYESRNPVQADIPPGEQGVLFFEQEYPF